jgi:hypothetical protein
MYFSDTLLTLAAALARAMYRTSRDPRRVTHAVLAPQVNHAFLDFLLQSSGLGNRVAALLPTNMTHFMMSLEVATLE